MVRGLRDAKEVKDEMQHLLCRISKMLEHHGARRLLTSADIQALWCWEFIQVELSSVVTSLTQVYPLLELALYYLDGDLLDLFSFGSTVNYNLRFYLDKIEIGTSLYGCCYSQVIRIPDRPLKSMLELLSWVAESLCRYKYLLQDDDGDRNSTRSSSSCVANAGLDTCLITIQGAKRNNMVRWFMSDQENNNTLKVISMVGPVGVGKTALAMEIYHQLQQNEGGHYFHCCAALKVSHRPAGIEELLKHILSQISKPATVATESSIQSSQATMLEHEVLVANIYQYLQDKRYLILIDDIWKESDWDIIKGAFPQNSSGSRIVITTQLKRVAQRCCSYSSDGLLYEVKPLNEVDSEQLLCREAFGFEDGCPPENLKKVCDEILRRCGGIPLFIIGMADWLREQQQEVHSISSNTNYSPEEVPQLLKQFESRLSPTYDDLPYLLKFFLSYMNAFPVGYMFDKDGLIRRWVDIFRLTGILSGIAGGLFIQADLQPKPLNDVEAEECFSMLRDRNVITRVATNEHSYIVEENCHWQVNYFMQQFLASKAAEKRMFFTSGTLTSERTEGGKTLRHLSLHQPDPEPPVLLGGMDLSHTRSLAISGKVDRIPLDMFSQLVVLDLEGWQCFADKDMLVICKMFFLRHLILRKTRGFTKLPPEIKELRHLHTLDISHTQISELPSQICELKELQKLDLRSTQVRQLPEKFWKLRQLEHLLVGGDGVNQYETAAEIPKYIRSFQSLVTLATVDLSKCSPSLVQRIGYSLYDLQVLAITLSFPQCTDGTFQKVLCSFMRKLKMLSSLTIHCGLGCCMDFLDSLPSDLLKFKVTGGRFTRLPKFSREHHKLTFVEITICNLHPGDLAILGNLPELVCLVLGLHFIPEAEIMIDGEGFQKLERLSFTCRVPWLNFSQGAMPSLTYLELKIAGSIARQENVPSGISNLSSLSDVAIRYHANYINSPSVKRTVEAVRKGVAEMPINLFVNGIEDQEEYVQARASTSQSKIEEEE